MQAGLQSIRSAARSRRSSSRCSASHTPASCQSRKRRQHVMLEPHPISSGSISHWMPVRSTNRISVSAARSATRGLPPCGRGRATGSRGSMIDQRASETRGDAMPPHESDRQAVQGFERRSKSALLPSRTSTPAGRSKSPTEIADLQEDAPQTVHKHSDITSSPLNRYLLVRAIDYSATLS